MDFNGDIVFAVADTRPLNIDFKTELLPTKIIKKGDVIVAERKAPKNRWVYKVKFNGYDEYLGKLEEVLDKLSEDCEYIYQLMDMYEEVMIIVYIRSDFGQIGYSLPITIIRKLALIGCTISFDILSFGMVESKESQ